MNNPLDILKAISNPEQFVRNFAKKNNNPILNNLINMAEKNNKKGVEQFARNIFKEQGKDFDNITSNLK